MHVTVKQLLAARDGEPLAVEAQQHIEHCDDCRGEIARLEGVRISLRALPAFEPPVERWSRVQERACSRPARSLRLPLAACAAGLVVVALAGLLWPRPQQRLHDQARRDPATFDRSTDRVAYNGLAALRDRSVELERVLRSLPPRRIVEPAGTATMIDGLERRIAWVDYQLTWASEAGLTPAQAQRLWDERVDLLDSLVILRSVQASQWDF